MRALIALWAVAAAVWLAAPADRAMAQTGPTTPVNIPDANLRALWETALSKSPGDTITRAEMASLAGGWNGSHATWYTAGDPPSPPATVIRDLTGMEYATGFTLMRSSYHRISDLRPLAGLTSLDFLILSFNVISDVSPLAGLTNLRELSLRHNLVTDISPLCGLTGLRDLHLDDNQVSDIRPLACLTALSRLSLHDNHISDIGPLAGLTGMRELSLHDNQISDLGPLTRLNGLIHLTLAGNQVSDLTPLQGKNNLELLNLNYNEQVTDVSVVRGMTSLARLQLDGTGVVDLAPLAANTGLGSGDQVYLRDVPNLNANAETHIATLRGRGVNVYTSTPLRRDTMVRGVQVTPGVESLTLTWNRLATATGFTPTGYRLQWKGEGDYSFLTSATPPRHHDVAGLATTSYTIPGLTPGVEYKVRVRAHGAYGIPSALVWCIPLASASDPVTCERRAASGGGAPAQDSMSVRPSVESLIVSWSRIAGASGYIVQWKSGEQRYDPAARQAQVADRGTTNYVISGLTAGTEYTVRVIPTRADAPDGAPVGEATGTPLPPVAAAIADAVVTEGGEANLLVVLDQPAASQVTVTWTTQDGTAKAGQDYRAMAGRLTFRRGDREAGLTVPTLEDQQVEPAERFRVLLTGGAVPAAATVTITDDDTESARGQALGMVLAAMGRWAAADAVEVIADRFDGRFSGRQAMEGQVSVAGQPLAAAGGGAQDAAWSPAELSPAALSAAELISTSRFDLPVGRQEPAAGASGGASGDGGGALGLRVWGRGVAGGFAGRPAADARADGGVVGGYLGIDYGIRHDVLLGVAFAHSRSGVDYAIDSVTDGKADLAVTSVLPYAHWRPHAGLGAWGLLGVGLGGAGLQDEAGTVQTDLLMWLAAAGLRHEVARWRGIDVTLKADAFLTDWTTGARAGLPAVTVEAWRLRLRLEGRRPWEVSPVSRLTPSVEVGGRLDGGSAEYGLGMEVGGALAWTQSDLGLEVEAQGRTLLAHQRGFGEWGGGLTVKVDPGQAGLGPWLTFGTGWGSAESRIAQLWDSREAFGAGADGAGQAPELAPDRLALEAGWGVAAPGGAGLLTPYAGLSMAGSELSGYRLGARLQAESGMSLGLEGRQSPAAGYAVMLNGRLDW